MRVVFKQRFRAGIMSKVFGTGMVGLLIVVLAMSWLTINYMERDIEENAHKQLNLAIQLEMALIDQHLAYLKNLAATVAASPQVLEALKAGNSADLGTYLRTFKRSTENLHILTVVSREGKVLARANSDQTGQTFTANGLVSLALGGTPVASPEIIPEAEWGPEGEEIRKRVTIPVKATKGSEERKETAVTEALSLVGAAPVKDGTGEVVGAVIAAEVLNQNYGIVDEVRTRTDGLVTATIALDGIRVTTNVKLLDEQGRPTENRAIGTIYSIPVMASLRAGQEYRGRALVAGQWQKTIYVPLKDHAGNVIAGPYVGIPEATFTGLRARFIRTLVPVSLGGLLVAALFSFLMGRSLTRAVGQVRDQLEQLALGGGDLTRELQLRTRDELGDLVRAFNRFLATLREMVRQVRDSSQAVAASASHVTGTTQQIFAAAEGAAQSAGQVAGGTTEQAQASDELLRTIEQLEETIRQIASGSQQTAGEVQKASHLLGEMVAAIDGVAGSARGVAESAGQAAAGARAGAQVVERAVVAMQRIREVVGESAERIRDLGQLSSEIGEITQVISGIAEQTNLLALNAAIEAARAGEHGRGFAVVAEEVRKLAERSAGSAKQIADLIDNVRARTAEAVTTMDAGTAAVEEGSRLAADAGRALQDILGVAERASQEVQSISAAAEQLRDHAEQVVHAFDALAAVSEENTAATEEMAAGATQVTKTVERVAAVSHGNARAAEQVSSVVERLRASAEEVASAAQSMAKIASDLQEQVARFKV